MDENTRVAVRHCLSKIRSLVEDPESAPGNPRAARATLQLGYNLGRLSELLPGGRERFWDDWKEPGSNWNPDELRERLARLERDFGDPPGRGGDPGNRGEKGS